MGLVEMKEAQPLNMEEAQRMNAYWRAASYLHITCALRRIRHSVQ